MRTLLYNEKIAIVTLHDAWHVKVYFSFPSLLTGSRHYSCTPLLASHAIFKTSILGHFDSLVIVQLGFIHQINVTLSYMMAGKLS